MKYQQGQKDKEKGIEKKDEQKEKRIKKLTKNERKFRMHRKINKQ